MLVSSLRVAGAKSTESLNKYLRSKTKEWKEELSVVDIVLETNIKRLKKIIEGYSL